METTKKDKRNMKVYYSSGYNFADVPTIRLKGKWLKEFGFDGDTPIEVQCEDGKITIVPREPIEERIITTIVRNGVSVVAEERVVYR